MATKRTSVTHKPRSQARVKKPEPKKKGEQSVTEATRADVPEGGEQPVTGGKGSKRGRVD